MEKDGRPKKHARQPCGIQYMWLLSSEEMVEAFQKTAQWCFVYQNRRAFGR